jgi:hypothetical protein
MCFSRVYVYKTTGKQVFVCIYAVFDGQRQRGFREREREREKHKTEKIVESDIKHLESLCVISWTALIF